MDARDLAVPDGDLLRVVGAVVAHHLVEARAAQLAGERRGGALLRAGQLGVRVQVQVQRQGVPDDPTLHPAHTFAARSQIAHIPLSAGAAAMGVDA